MNYQDFAGSYLANYLMSYNEDLEVSGSPMTLFGDIYTWLNLSTSRLNPDEEAAEPAYELSAEFKNIWEYTIRGKSLYLFELFSTNLLRWAFSESSDSAHLVRLRQHVMEMVEEHDLEFDTQVGFVIQSVDGCSFSVEASASVLGSEIWSEKIFVTYG
jgi:hypothetical protein